MLTSRYYDQMRIWLVRRGVEAVGSQLDSRSLRLLKISERRLGDVVPPGAEFFSGYAGVHLLSGVEEMRVGGGVGLTEGQRGWWARAWCRTEKSCKARICGCRQEPAD